MKVRMIGKLKTKKIVIKVGLLSVILLFLSCRVDHNFYFDINSQEVKCCDNKKIYYLDISSKVDEVSLRWKGKREDAPSTLNFDSIPKEYELYRDGLLTNKKFKLKKDTKYFIEKVGGGGVGFVINIFTDSNCKVSKTTHPKCGIENLNN